MLSAIRNLFGTSPNDNPYQAMAGRNSNALYGMRPIGHAVGLVDGYNHQFLSLAGNWVKTLNSGTIATQDGNPTTLKLTTANTQDSVTSCQLSLDGGTTVIKPFTLSATASIWHGLMAKGSDMTNCGILIGFSNTATANIFGTGGSRGAIGSGITDFIGWHKPDSSLVWRFVVRTSSTSTSQTLTGLATAADDTYALHQMRIGDGTKAIEAYYNAYRGGNPTFVQTTTTNFPSTSTNLTLLIAIQTSANAAKSLTIKRPYAFQDAAQF